MNNLLNLCLVFLVVVILVILVSICRVFFKGVLLLFSVEICFKSFEFVGDISKMFRKLYNFDCV